MQDLQVQENEVIVQKREAWGQMGVAVYQTEMQLQVEAQSYLKSLEVMPSTIDEVPKAEENLKTAKAGQKKVEEKRKAVTSKFDDVTKRLMASEKSFDTPIQQYSAAIIKIKKEDEVIKAKQQNILEEANRCKEFFQNQKINIESSLNNKVIDLVNRCYEKALNDNIAVSEVGVYIATSKASVTAKNFTALTQTFNPAYITTSEVEEICRDNFNVNQQYFADLFATELDKKFSDYEIAFENKAQALALSQKEEADKRAQIQAQANHQAMANKIESASYVPSVAPSETKALKHNYIICMEENVESALIIMAAFSANLPQCLKHLRVTNWFQLSIKQVAGALTKVKMEDENFAPQGIIFNKIDKL